METGLIAALFDVEQYPSEFLKRCGDLVCIEVTYRKVWDDGFGARGWKANTTIGDPAIIASTRETGHRITTSVFVHDILDHLLSGFGVSGHRSEAMALRQLARRTGSNPRPDYEQMVREDIINGRVNGETLISFLPEQLRAMLPPDTALTDRQKLARLREALGEACLVGLLIDHFFVLGKSGESHAEASWWQLGLDPGKRTAIGLAIQTLLDEVDRIAEASGVETLTASLAVSNKQCVMTLRDCPFPRAVYRAEVA